MNKHGNINPLFQESQSIDKNKLVILLETFEAMGLATLKQISIEAGISLKSLREIINGKRMITNKMASRLVSYFGTQILKKENI